MYLVKFLKKKKKKKGEKKTGKGYFTKGQLGKKWFLLIFQKLLTFDFEKKSRNEKYLV